MHRAIIRVVSLAITILYAVIMASQATMPQQPTPPPAGFPSGESTGNKPEADRAQSTDTSVASQPALLTRARAGDGMSIGGGDLLLVAVSGASDYNHEVRVAGDGSINLPFIGPVRVAGLTPREVASDVRTRLSEGGYFNNPQVSVFIKEYATQGVSVLGEVQKPGIYPLLGARTLFDLLSAAQGTTPAASDRVSITHRDRPQHPEMIKLSYDAKDSAQSNVPVLPGDTIVVQKAGMVYVVGDVQKPSGIVMANPGLTVLQAIALAQGINSNAALDKARLVRKTSDGETYIPLQLKKMLAAQVPDIKVQPDDVIFVPNSMLKTGFKRGLEAAVQTVTGVIVYRRY
jgi:polysaccharide biosynthesis/export protein